MVVDTAAGCATYTSGERGRLEVPDRYILLPILNRNVSMFRSPILDLSETTQVKPIDDAYFGRIYDSCPERYRYSLTAKTKCVYVKLQNADDAERRLKDLSVLVRFTMNFMCEKGPLVFAFGLYAEQRRKFNPIKYYDIPAGAERQDLASISYKIKDGSSADAIEAYHSTVEAAVARNPLALLSLSRIMSNLAVNP